ncbi:trypsin-like peptidase domain-containing protein [Streptomyces sp. NPDC002082]|uniref:VMAP-C domain-containing protein n=1 Tax=Streptomyces sp. NPDC002082 TaxID=3154772 RepID=UPI0033311A7B
MTAAKLEELTRRATVRIGPQGDPDRLWGTGFFVAPGWVLSCAHVIPGVERPEAVGTFLVHGRHGSTPARLGYWLGGGFDPEQDLVLIRLADDSVRHTCVRLGDRSDAPSRVTVYGWRAAEGCKPQTWSGHCVINGSDGSSGLTLGPETEIPHGASGGPVLDRDRGVVLGVVKARRRGKDGGLAIAATALRGFARAVPVGGEQGLGREPYRELIRAHDQWHHRMREEPGSEAKSWVAAQEGIVPSGERVWTPRDSAAASALLAELPPPVSTRELESLIKVAVGEEPLWPGAVAARDWRDGHGWLYETADGDDIAFLHYLLLVARTCAAERPGPAAELERWALQRAGQLPVYYRALLKTPRIAAWVAERVAGAEAGGPVVAVELRPDAYRPQDRFHWRIWTWAEEAGCFRAWDEGDEPEGASLAELPYLLSEPLHEIFGRTDTEDGPARLEFVLPVECFDENVHLWRSRLVARTMRPDPADRPFGVHRQVVLRPLEREATPRELHRERWLGVAEGALETLPLRWPEAGSEVLEAAPAGAVPLVCRTTGDGAEPLREVIRAGYAVALWRRGDPHQAGCGTPCGDLEDRVARLLRRARRAGALPEELRMLRERISRADADADWAEPLALLYDDPDRPLPEPAGLLNSP